MENVCIPMHLDAFALSPDCCEGQHSRIAPYTQPNYTSLRLDSHLIQHDVLDHIDFHNTQPGTKNPRIADLGLPPPNNIKKNRLGVHLHWSLPRFYRAAKSSARKKPSNADANADITQPVFRTVPNRWLITRHLKNFKDANLLPEYQSWIVESDAVRNIKTIGDDVDLESDVAPFVSYDPTESQQSTDKPPDLLKAQTEIFLGQKFDLSSWKEDSNRQHLHGGLCVLNSSNTIFPDYALHNTNVFSIIDNFRIGSASDEPSYLDVAHADYYVIGWHQDGGNDPMNEDLSTDGDDPDLNARLSQLNLQLPKTKADVEGTQKVKTRCLIYGSIFEVVYNAAKKPEHSAAEKSALNFTNGVKMEPLSIGTTPLDSILTFLDAHQGDVETFLGPGTSDLAKYILELSTLLYASADEYDSRTQAQDLIAQQNFGKSQGGLHWTFAKKSDGQTPQVPSTAEAGLLRDLNESQLRLDTASYKLKSLRWQMFAEWWKYVSTYLPTKDNERKKFVDKYTATVKSLRDAMKPSQGDGGLINEVTTLTDNVTKLSQKIDCKSSTRDPFCQRIDPTLCIAGLESGWPSDVTEVLTVQLESDLGKAPDSASIIFKDHANPVPTDHHLADTALNLLAFCMQNSGTANGANGPPKIMGFQSWGDQNPFVPVFIEWESLYYHIDKDDWKVELRPSPVGHPNEQVRYVPSRVLTDNSTPGQKGSAPKDPTKDTRSISGRSLILPQPVFSLENVVLNVLGSPAAADIIKDPSQRQKLHDDIREIKFLSAPLSGLTNHLLTRCEGAHVKPNLRSQGMVVQPIPVAVTASVEVGIGIPELGLIDAESSLTPYGNLMPFNVVDYPNDPFKAVTHGQMIFTKINIVDKFGQSICVPNPGPRRRIPVLPPDYGIYPCLSDYLAPDVIGNRLNTVFPPKDPVVSGSWPLCQFVQLTPAINQNARINASFLIQDTLTDGSFAPWREATDYENPIWGWLVINYADNGLQFFESDGKFYCEIRQGGIRGTTTSTTKYLPYKPKDLTLNDPRRAQLQKLLERLSPDNDPDGKYLQAFFDMINGGIQNMPFPPSSYAAYANSIVGKPLALVNVGWSLELAEPAISPQYGYFLRPDPPDPMAVLQSYNFPLKIGDVDRSFDGVLGYFTADNPSGPTTQQLTHFNKLYTYFNEHQHPDVKIIEPDDFTLTPYYLHPEPDKTSNMTIARERQYSVTSILMDPYAPIHGYSPILPTQALTLSPWTTEEAFKNMHAFFRLGPSLLTQDVPVSASAITADDVIKLPVSGSKGTWSWLQPYAINPPVLVPGSATLPPVTTKEEDDTVFGEIPVIEDVGDVKYAKGPYTFVEGYLQLAGSLSGKT